MNNKDKYIKKVDEIKVDAKTKEKLIKDALEKHNQKKKSRIITRSLVACAACAVIAISGTLITLDNLNKDLNPNQNQNVVEHEIVAKANLSEAGIERIENIEELEEILNNNQNNDRYFESNMSIDSTTEGITEESGSISDTNSIDKNSSTDYSKTNVQHENVDEADIVKTDGKYIYYLINGSNYYNEITEIKVKIIDVDTRKVISEINVNEDGYKYATAIEMFLKDNKLVVMETRINNLNENENESRTETVAIVYNISDKNNIVKEREISVEGDYTDSRMINDNLYFISTKYNYVYDVDYYGLDEAKTEDENETNIELPVVRDTIVSDEYKNIDCTDIYYLRDSDDTNYTFITAANINSDEEAYTETFLGFGDTIYCSENNMYVVKGKYSSDYSRIFGTYNYDSETDIFKFKLGDNNIEFVGKGNVTGTVNNQFSMDEYNGYFRIATTSYNEKSETTNNVIILDENLKEVGSLKGLEDGEKIYSVRFMGDIGYVVTFKEIDPLLVIDLKDPTNPEVKGELKIPGYSSYLHPYDETHVIGIGKNTEDNGYGGVTSTGIKISMFDVSDLNNPKEIFKTSIGEEYGYSEALDNHKAVLCSREKEILAIPVSVYDDEERFQGAVIFSIDLENKEFVEKAKIGSNDNEYKTYDEYYNDIIKRIIYIGDYLYTLSDKKVNIIDMNTFKIVDKIEF